MKLERTSLEETCEVNVVLTNKPGQCSYAVEVFRQVTRLESEAVGEILYIEKVVQGNPLYATQEIHHALVAYDEARKVLLKALAKANKNKS